MPFYRSLAKHTEIDLKVIFAARIGLTPYFDKAMNTTISWNMDLLGGYSYVFLPEADRITSTGPLKVNNPSIGAELACHAPDTVLVYGYNQITSLRALWWCRRNRVPAIMISDSELKTIRSAWKDMVRKMLLPQLMKQFSAFLTVGDCNEDYYVHCGVPRERLFRSPFTIDEGAYLAARGDRVRLRAEVRKQLGIGEDEVVALTVGKLSKRKRPGDVIAAARRLKSADLPARLSFLLVGDGEEMQELRHTVANEDLPVRLVGFINVDELPRFYAVADMIVHCSSRDPHPLVMSEGACMGLPLVVTDRVGATGPTDIARPGENAVVFPLGDVSMLAVEVEALVRNSDRRKAMGRRSQEIFEALDMNRSVEGMLNAVRYCVKPSKRCV